ncbi:MAG TPA: hypothetical protein VJQ54_24300, partial [Candidatus Sulfotelmatobacter sp.]|nr:hypothetical protein [Candidatus Sulfotelmatobacter sp.]
WVFFFNHANKPAMVQFSRVLEKPAVSIREITVGQKIPATGADLRLETEVPAESVRVYRIDF